MTELAIDDIFSSLEAHATRLSEVSDQANGILSNIENRLLKLNVGIEVWYSRPIEASDPKGGVGGINTTSRIVQLLGFARIDGKWVLAVKPMERVAGYFEGDTSCPFEDEFAAGDPVPLLRASRNLRTAAVRAMPEFLAQLNDTVAATVQQIETVTAQFQ